VSEVIAVPEQRRECTHGLLNRRSMVHPIVDDVRFLLFTAIECWTKVLEVVVVVKLVIGTDARIIVAHWLSISSIGVRGDNV